MGFCFLAALHGVSVSLRTSADERQRPSPPIILIIIIIIIHFKDMNKPGGHMSVKNTRSEEN